MNEIPFYTEHEGTIRISGTTDPVAAGRCAMHYLERNVTQVEFLCIGANANQQAMKSMGVFMNTFRQNNEGKGMDIAFQPLRFSVFTKPQAGSSDTQDTMKDATVWRTVIVTANEKLPANTPADQG